MEDLVIKLLFEGKTQPEITAYLKDQNIKPNSLSSVEKALKKIKAKYKANTLFHLAVILCKGRGLSKIIKEQPLKTSKIPVDFKVYEEISLKSKDKILELPTKK